MRVTSLRTTLILLPLVAAIASCAGNPTGVGPGALRLAGAERKWKETALHTYSFKSTIDCFCRGSFRGPMLVTVRQGMVTAVVDVASGATQPLSDRAPIDSLFGLTRAELLARPALLTVTYDSKLGFPASIAYGDRAVDGGAVVTVSDVVAIP